MSEVSEKERRDAERADKAWQDDVRAALQVSLDWAVVQDQKRYEQLQDANLQVETATARLWELKKLQEHLREELHRNKTMGEAVLALAREAGITDLVPTAGIVDMVRKVESVEDSVQ